MKLAIGTAQFGLPYGIANQCGQVSRDEAAAILAMARAGGIDTLDTAVAYGNSEARLGEAGVTGWKIVSKLPPFPVDCHDIAAWCEAQLRGSLARLAVPHLYALLLHQPAQLGGPRGAELWDALDHLKRAGLVQKTGISIYDPAELDQLTPRFHFEVIQAPFSVLDRRLLDSGYLRRLFAKGVEWHARSAFLQGLLTMPSHLRPKQFARWKPVFDELEAWAAHTGAPRIEACLRFALAPPEIARVVVGVDSVQHLEQLLAIARAQRDIPPPAFPTGDPELINPARWAV